MYIYIYSDVFFSSDCLRFSRFFQGIYHPKGPSAPPT